MTGEYESVVKAITPRDYNCRKIEVKELYEISPDDYHGHGDKLVYIENNSIHVCNRGYGWSMTLNHKDSFNFVWGGECVEPPITTVAEGYEMLQDCIKKHNKEFCGECDYMFTKIPNALRIFDDENKKIMDVSFNESGTIASVLWYVLPFNFFARIKHYQPSTHCYVRADREDKA